MAFLQVYELKALEHGSNIMLQKIYKLKVRVLLNEPSWLENVVIACRWIDVIIIMLKERRHAGLKTNKVGHYYYCYD